MQPILRAEPRSFCFYLSEEGVRRLWSESRQAFEATAAQTSGLVNNFFLLSNWFLWLLRMRHWWNISFLKKRVFTSHLQNKSRNHDICIINFSAPNQLLWKHRVMKFWGAYHLTENSGWKVNGKVIFWKFQPKNFEVVLSFRLVRTKRNVAYH